MTKNEHLFIETRHVCVTVVPPTGTNNKSIWLSYTCYGTCAGVPLVSRFECTPDRTDGRTDTKTLYAFC